MVSCTTSGGRGAIVEASCSTGEALAAGGIGANKDVADIASGSVILDIESRGPVSAGKAVDGAIDCIEAIG